MIDVDTTTTTSWTPIQDAPVTGTCDWTASSAGLYQGSNAWGNYPDYNTLMGCNALYNGASFTDFIFEAEVDAVADNDGMGALDRRPTQHL